MRLAPVALSQNRSCYRGELERGASSEAPGMFCRKRSEPQVRLIEVIVKAAQSDTVPFLRQC